MSEETTETTQTTETTESTETTQTTEQNASTEQTTETTSANETSSEGDISGDISGETESTTETTESTNSGDISGENEGDGDETEGDGDGEEESSENEFIGVPDEGYEAFTLPDDVPVDEAKQTKFNDLAKEIGLSQAGAQKLVDYYAADLQEAVDGHMKTLDSYTAAAQADAEIGGDNFNDTIKLGSEAVKAYGSPEFRKLLSETGMGKHPEMLRTFRKIGVDMQEAQSHSGSEVVSDTKPTRAESLYGKKT